MAKSEEQKAEAREAKAARKEISRKEAEAREAEMAAALGRIPSAQPPTPAPLPNPVIPGDVVVGPAPVAAPVGEPAPVSSLVPPPPAITDLIISKDEKMTVSWNSTMANQQIQIITASNEPVTEVLKGEHKQFSLKRNPRIWPEVVKKGFGIYYFRARCWDGKAWTPWVSESFEYQAPPVKVVVPPVVPPTPVVPPVVPPTPVVVRRTRVTPVAPVKAPLVNLQFVVTVCGALVLLGLLVYLGITIGRDQGSYAKGASQAPPAIEDHVQEAAPAPTTANPVTTTPPVPQGVSIGNINNGNGNVNVYVQNEEQRSASHMVRRFPKPLGWPAKPVRFEKIMPAGHTGTNAFSVEKVVQPGDGVAFVTPKPEEGWLCIPKVTPNWPAYRACLGYGSETDADWLETRPVNPDTAVPDGVMFAYWIQSGGDHQTKIEFIFTRFCH